MTISKLSVMENVVFIADPHCPKNHNLDEVATIELYSSIFTEVVTNCYTYRSQQYILKRILISYNCPKL